jgi:hypothetical protein
LNGGGGELQGQIDQLAGAQNKAIDILRTQVDTTGEVIKEEEKRKTVQYETEMGKRRAEYQVQLELQRD